MGGGNQTYKGSELIDIGEAFHIHDLGKEDDSRSKAYPGDGSEQPDDRAFLAAAYILSEFSEDFNSMHSMKMKLIQEKCERIPGRAVIKW